MKKFATIRHEKRKGAEQFNGILAENNRDFSKANIDKNLTHKNICLTPSIYSDYSDFVARKQEQIRASNKLKGTKNRMVRQIKDNKTGKTDFGAMLQEFVFGHSPGALTEDQSIEYLKMADKFIRDWFTDLEIVSSIIHLDEKTPHLHIWTSYFDTVQNKFIQKELSQQGKTDINAIRKAFQAQVADKYGLAAQDGSVVKSHDGSKASTVIDKLKKEISDLENGVPTEEQLKNSSITINNKTIPLPKFINQSIAENTALKEQNKHLEQELELLRVELHQEQQKTLKTDSEQDIKIKKQIDTELAEQGQVGKKRTRS